MTYLPEVDNIVVIKDGAISEVGTYKELLAQKGAFADVLVQFLSEELEEKKVYQNKVNVHLIILWSYL